MLRFDDKYIKNQNVRKKVLLINTPISKDVIDIIVQYDPIVHDDKKLQRIQSLDLQSASSFSFFKSVIKKDNVDKLKPVTILLFAAGITCPLILTLPIFYGIPEVIKASWRTAARKMPTYSRKMPTYSGEEIDSYLEKLEQCTTEDFNEFLKTFIRHAQVVESTHDWCSINSDFIKNLTTGKKGEPYPTRLTKLKAIEDYLQMPSNIQSRLYKILVDDLRILSTSLPRHGRQP
jgi:hypothetical protein